MVLLNRALERPQRLSASLHPRQVLAVAGVVIVIVALLQLLQTSDAATSSFAIQQLERNKVELRARVSQLEADIASLSSLTRIEQEGQKRLGLVPPAGRQQLQVNVPWPAEDQQWLPTRFAPDEKPRVSEQDSPWWRDLLKLLPFY